MPHPSNALSGVAILGILGIAGVFAWTYSGEVDVVHSQGIAPSDKPNGEAQDDVNLPNWAERTTVPVLSELAPAEIMLESFFGEEADAVRALIAEKGGDLATMNMPVSEAQFRAALPDWLVFKPVERAEWRRAMKSLPDEIDNDWIQERLGMTTDLTPDQLISLDALASLYTPDLELTIDRYMDTLEEAMAYDLQRDRIQVSPFISWKSPALEPQFKSFYSLSRAGSGWNASAELNQFEHPVAYAARGDLAKGIEIRNTAIREAISNM